MEQSKTIDVIAMLTLDNLNKDYIERTHWGWKYNLSYSSNTNTDLLFFNKDGFTSKHFHNNKINRLFCVYGMLRIDYQPDGEIGFKDKYISPSSAIRVTDIMPKVIHRLTALEESLIIEIDSAKPNFRCSKEDIIRLDKGMKE